ncbi:hypothetical protein LA080_015084 [Diaporthe eres]|nr:hypothetical protein LA080_015084 [Diaporthe eres]
MGCLPGVPRKATFFLATSISEDPTEIELCKLHAMNSTRRGRIHAMVQPIHSRTAVSSCTPPHFPLSRSGATPTTEVQVDGRESSFSAGQCLGHSSLKPDRFGNCIGEVASCVGAVLWLSPRPLKLIRSPNGRRKRGKI